MYKNLRLFCGLVVFITIGMAGTANSTPAGDAFYRKETRLLLSKVYSAFIPFFENISDNRLGFIKLNAPPLIADVPKIGVKDTPVPFSSADFTDKFSNASPLVKIKIVSLPGIGILKYDLLNITPGLEIAVGNISKITFVPPAGYVGGPISFQWNGSDGLQYAATPKNVNITIQPANIAPIAAVDSYTAPRGGTLTILSPGVLENDTDPDGNTLNAVKVSNPTNGSVTLNASGSFTYKHNGSQSTSDNFTYKVNDGTLDGNTVNVAIAIVNSAPVVYDIEKNGTKLSPITFSPDDFKNRYSDPNSDPLVKVKIISTPATGTLKLNGIAVTNDQDIDVASLGGLSFTPPFNWLGTTSFTWNGFDGTVYADSPGKVNLTIVLPDDPTAKIGLAKYLASTRPALNATYDVKFVFTATNYGMNGLEDVSIRDNLTLAFGGAALIIKSISAFGGLKANTSFNGSGNTELLDISSKLSAGEEARIELVVNVKPGSAGGTFQNSATAEATSSANGTKVRDISTDGLKPDPLFANDVSPADATPIQLAIQPTFVPQGFSPNGDGRNDKLVIQNASGKHISLDVYNRWGSRIYKSSDYKNDWGGEVSEGFFVGKDIPDGTYYYIIIIERKDKYAGSITVNR